MQSSHAKKKEKYIQRQRNSMSDYGQPKQSICTLHLHYVLQNCSLDEFKPIFSREKKGGLNSESIPTYLPLCSSVVASLQRISNNSNDSEEQEGRALPKTFLFVLYF